MKARLLGFGDLEVEGQRYDADVVIEGGRVRRRRKKPSKPYRDRFGHTPLSAKESIPWGGPSLIVGTGADGLLPIMAQVRKEAARRNVEIVQHAQLEADIKAGRISYSSPIGKALIGKESGEIVEVNEALRNDEIDRGSNVEALDAHVEQPVERRGILHIYEST